MVDEEGFKTEPAGALNYLLQFLFQECRNTIRVRHWFRTRLSIELEELLTRTTTGKLFEAIAVSMFMNMHLILETLFKYF